MSIRVSVQTDDFNVSEEIDQLRRDRADTGAVAVFVGTVRDINEGTAVQEMTLEHYPGMTEKSLQSMVELAIDAFDIHGATVIHRVGALKPTDQIVLVATSSRHRQQAFESCEFLMDYLKTTAPFWKKEATPQSQRWVDARVSDDQAMARWTHIFKRVALKKEGA